MYSMFVTSENLSIQKSTAANQSTPRFKMSGNDTGESSTGQFSNPTTPRKPKTHDERRNDANRTIDSYISYVTENRIHLTDHQLENSDRFLNAKIRDMAEFHQ